VVNERKILALVMWYLQVIDLLKRLLSSGRDAKLVIWHAALDGHMKDRMLRHPMDTRQWKPLILTALSSPMIKKCEIRLKY
jgi:hypothetical protein